MLIILLSAFTKSCSARDSRELFLTSQQSPVRPYNSCFAGVASIVEAERSYVCYCWCITTVKVTDDNIWHSFPVFLRQSDYTARTQEHDGHSVPALQRSTNSAHITDQWLFSTFSEVSLYHHQKGTFYQIPS